MIERQVTLIKAVLEVHGMPPALAAERAASIAPLLDIARWEGTYAVLSRQVRLMVAAAARDREGSSMAGIVPWSPASERAGQISAAIIQALAACGLLPLVKGRA